MENFVVNVACDDPGASVGAQLVLPLLQERLDVQALQYAAKKAEEAQAEVIRMEVGGAPDREGRSEDRGWEDWDECFMRPPVPSLCFCGACAS